MLDLNSMAINTACMDPEDKAGETISTIAIPISKATDGITISIGIKAIDVQNGITIRERALDRRCCLFYLLDSFSNGCEYLTGVKKRKTLSTGIFVLGTQRKYILSVSGSSMTQSARRETEID
jgi:hypothetical protein